MTDIDVEIANSLKEIEEIKEDTRAIVAKMKKLNNTVEKTTSPVTSPKTASRNSTYEQKMRAKGLKKITLWIPDECADDLKLMASICCDNKDLIPSTVRSLTTGRMKGINNV